MYFNFEGVEWVQKAIFLGDEPTKDQIAQEFGDDPDGFVLECAEARSQGWDYFKHYIGYYNAHYHSQSDNGIL